MPFSPFSRVALINRTSQMLQEISLAGARSRIVCQFCATSLNALVLVSAASSFVRFGEKTEAQWKCWKSLDGKYFAQLRAPVMIKRNTSTHTHTHAPCNMPKTERRNSQAKSCKERKIKAEKKKKKWFSWNLFRSSKIFCFIYSASVDEVGSAFSCAPSVEVEVSKQESE